MVPSAALMPPAARTVWASSRRRLPTHSTCWPDSASSIAARRPAAPVPMTRTPVVLRAGHGVTTEVGAQLGALPFTALRVDLDRAHGGEQEHPADDEQHHGDARAEQDDVDGVHDRRTATIAQKVAEEDRRDPQADEQPLLPVVGEPQADREANERKAAARKSVTPSRCRSIILRPRRCRSLYVCWPSSASDRWGHVGYVRADARDLAAGHYAHRVARVVEAERPRPARPTAAPRRGRRPTGTSSGRASPGPRPIRPGPRSRQARARARARRPPPPDLQCPRAPGT